MKKTIVWGTVAGVGLLLSAILGASAVQFPEGGIAIKVPEHSTESLPRSSGNAG